MKIKSIEHEANPLHIYCRLRRIMWKKLAIMLAYLYEKTIYNTVLHRLIVAEIRHIMRKKERMDVRAPGVPAEHGYFERR